MTGESLAFLGAMIGCVQEPAFVVCERGALVLANEHARQEIARGAGDRLGAHLD